jgi:hypothetical protein
MVLADGATAMQPIVDLPGEAKARIETQQKKTRPGTIALEL